MHENPLYIEDIYESFFGENPYNIMSGLNEEGRNKLIEFADILKASKKFSPLSAKIIPFHHPVEITWNQFLLVLEITWRIL